MLFNTLLGIYVGHKVNYDLKNFIDVFKGFLPEVYGDSRNSLYNLELLENDWSFNENFYEN